MDFLFAPITFFSIGEVPVQIDLFGLTAMILVMLQIWLYGKLSLWGPIWGGVAALMWITIGWRNNPPMFSLIILNVIILYLQVTNYLKWAKMKKEQAAKDAA